MDTASFVRGFLAWLDKQGIVSAVLHGWENGFEGSLSDVDFVVENNAFGRIPGMVAEYCAEAGWTLCQVIRHETTACYCICANRKSPTQVVALDGCSDYLRKGRLLMTSEHLLRERILLASGGWRLAEANELAYRFLKGAVKMKDARANVPELAAFSEAAKESCAGFLRAQWQVLLPDWTAECVQAAWRELDVRMMALPRRNRARDAARFLERLLHPTGLIMCGEGVDDRTTTTCGRLFFRRTARVPAWNWRQLKDIISSTLVHADRLAAPWCWMLPRDWVFKAEDGETCEQIAGRMAEHLANRCVRRWRLAG